MKFIIFLLIGGISGYSANRLLKRGSKGMLRNILLGIAGGFIGGWLFNVVGIDITNRALTQYFVSVIGAVVIIWIANMLRKN